VGGLEAGDKLVGQGELVLNMVGLIIDDLVEVS
jgi:hypothetical protein